MKKIYFKSILGPLLILLFVFSCEKFEEDFESVNDILKEQDFVVHKGVLTFRDKEAFKKLSDELKDKTPQQLNEWEASINFKSLRSIHEEAIQKEEVFLQQMAEKYPGNTSLTRKELGYTEFTTNLIKKGVFVVNEFETVDMNVTVPLYGALVNKDGVYRIGDDLIMPQLNVTKFIKGDASKLYLLKDAKESNDAMGIKVNEIARNSFNKSQSEMGRMKETWTSCDDVNSPYRLIVYEQVVEGNTLPDEVPCWGSEAWYWLRFRSLKRILGTWQNHKTSLWYGVSSLKIEHWRQCNYPYYCSPTTDLSYFSTPVDYVDFHVTIPYEDTYDYYFLREYELGPCASGGFASCPAQGISCPDTPDPRGVLYYTTRVYNVYGKGGTYCYVGE